MDTKLTPSTRRPWSRTVHLGTDFAIAASTSSDSTTDVPKNIGDRPYFVTLGTLEPRKDLGTVLDAFEYLWSHGKDVGLILIGNEGWNVEGLTRRIRRDQDEARPLFWLQGASDTNIRHLLKGATALIQSSLAEGFGLPIVEAASLGVRLVLSDIPVFHEIAGDDAVYFPVGQSAALVSAIERAIRGAFPRPRPVNVMSWSQSAGKLAGILL